MMKQILQLDPAAYRRHGIHVGHHDWAETNCYVDVLIELLHALGHEPIAALPFTLAIDFEGDQWTFFKFPLADLYDLFGLDVQELAIWRPLTAHIEEQVILGRPVLVELDSFFLPDTAGTAYQRQHVKSSVAVMAIDIENARLGYFHNQGYYHLHGDDFMNVFRLHNPDPSLLPPYVEFVKQRPGPGLSADELVNTSLKLLGRQLTRLPLANPFEKFKGRFQTDLGWLMQETLDIFHQYSFATLRQFGACFELGTTYLRWLQNHGQPHLDRCLAALTDISTGAKKLQFQLARSMARKKPLDLAVIDHMADQWANAMKELKSFYL